MSLDKLGNPSLNDVAAGARVSLATVDRVMNRRKGVKARTVERVLAAAVELGYLSEDERDLLSAPRPAQIAFPLPAVFSHPRTP